MTNPYAHDPDCDFWFDHYDRECTCGGSAPRPGLKPPAADPVQELHAIRAEIAELRRRLERLEAREAAVAQRIGLDGGEHVAQPCYARRKTGG
jgi:hypothetical protein